MDFFPMISQQDKYGWSGGNSEEVTPVPLPNTVVKLSSADGS